MIRRLENTTASRIKSQQYFPDAHSVLKELVENALDACASLIRISMNALSITVEDDGDGMCDLVSVGQTRCTSKLEETYRALGYRDECAEETSPSYGFRGQALYALKDLADVDVLTRKREPSQGQGSASASASCTHSSASQEYCALHKNLSTGAITCSTREYGTTITVSNMFKSLPVRKNLLNIKRELPKIIHLLEAYTLVHNVKVSLRFEGRLLLSRAGCLDILSALRKKYPLETFYEKRTDLFTLVIGDGPGKESFIFYRKKPVRNSMLAKAVQEAYSLFRKGRALFALDIKSRCDFSLSPDKMEILVGVKDQIVYGIKCAVEELFSESYIVHSACKESGTNYCEAPGMFSSTSSSLYTTGSIPNESLGIRSRNRSESQTLAGWCQSFGEQRTVCQREFQQESSHELPCTEDEQQRERAVSLLGHTSMAGKPLHEKNIYSIGLFHAKRAKATGGDGVSGMYTRPGASVTHVEKTHLPLQTDVDVPHASAFSFFAINTLAAIHAKIEKSDFSRMKVVGQFNSGFILCILPEEDKTTLLIVDQHASDEIQNFEKLQRGMQLKKQMLINAVSLSLSPVDVFLVESNAETFQRNGFLLYNNELTTVPVYGSTIFGVEDFYSLLENIKCGKSCFDRLRDIMASKACRASIMIGEALDYKKMCSVVRGLSTLNSPWCCPHGRPVFKILDVWRHKENG